MRASVDNIADTMLSLLGQLSASDRITGQVIKRMSEKLSADHRKVGAEVDSRMITQAPQLFPDPTLNDEQQLERLERAIAEHPAVQHPMFNYIDKLSRERLQHALAAFATEHYYLVRNFPRYVRIVQARLGSNEFIDAVASDECGNSYITQGPHVELYEKFLNAVGGANELTNRNPETYAFVFGHLDLMTKGTISEAIGALGPGHEFSIPRMFKSITQFMVNCVDKGWLPEDAKLYWVTHFQDDEVHYAQLKHVLLDRKYDWNWEEVYRGASKSLELRLNFWNSIVELCPHISKELAS